MIAVYRLRHYLTTFEFFNWLVMVKAAGATEIVFDIDNPRLKSLSREEVMEKFHSIIEPGPALAGLPFRYGNDEGGLGAVASQLVTWVKAGNKFERLQSVKPPGDHAYTVTIRRNGAAPMRNSNLDAWHKFAEEIGAFVIEDYLDKPIHLHDRIALYAGAKMNFGVCNGPIYVTSLTPYPVMQFVNNEPAVNSNVRWGSEVGENLPWSLPNQSFVWKEDSLDNLRRAFEGL